MPLAFAFVPYIAWVRGPWPPSSSFSWLSFHPTPDSTKKHWVRFSTLEPDQLEFNSKLLLPSFVTLDNLLNLSGLQLLNHLNGDGCTHVYPLHLHHDILAHPQQIALECCVLALSLTASAEQSWRSCHFVQNLLLGNVNGMTFNLAHAQATLFGLVPLVIQFRDFTLTECIQIWFLLSINCTLTATVLSNNQDLLISIFTRTFVTRVQISKGKRTWPLCI